MNPLPDRSSMVQQVQQRQLEIGSHLFQPFPPSLSGKFLTAFQIAFR
jgi:hypothetical protein